MRPEVLYEYDLPVELLDEIPRTEEVLEVLFARSKEKWLIPILITRQRIVWAYPEMSTVYRVYEMQYVDLQAAYVRFAHPPIPTSLHFETVNGQEYVFNNIKEGKDEIRGALMTLVSEMNQRSGNVWELSGRKTFMTDEFRLDRNPHPASELISSGRSSLKFHDGAADDDIFEDEKSVPGQGCFESNETLFSHFGKAGEDVFEETDAAADSAKQAENAYADADKKVARMVENVEAEIAESRRNAEDAAEAGAGSTAASKSEDCIVYGPGTGAVNDQWEEHKGGDALILSSPARKVSKEPEETKPEREYGPEDDDSIVYPSPFAQLESVPSAPQKPQREYGPEDDDSIVYPSADDEVVITPFRPGAKAADAKTAGEKTSGAAPDTADRITLDSRPLKEETASDEVVITPFKRPKPEFVPLTDESQVPVETLQKPAADGKEPEMDIASLRRPAYEVDDNIVVSPVKKTAPETEDDSVILRNQPESAKKITPSPLRKAVTLEPAERFNPAEVEKLLEELKHLRDSGIITEKEYRERSLKLFKDE